MAMRIMGDCEIEMNDQVREQMNVLAVSSDPVAPGGSVKFIQNQGQVLESIIRILARTVKQQVEQGQQDV